MWLTKYFIGIQQLKSLDVYIYIYIGLSFINVK